MQPTGPIFHMMIAAQRSHCTPRISGEYRREPAPGVRVARTAEVNESDLAEKARRIAVLGLASHQQHRPATGHCHWKHEAAPWLESIEPRW
jgi:hypothetical protein